MQTIPRPTQREYETIWDLIHNYGPICWLWDNLNLDYEEEGPVTVKTSDLWELKRAIIEDGGDGSTLPWLAGPFADAINTLLIDTPPWNWTRKIWKLAKENGGTLPPVTDLGGYPILYLDSENNVLCPDCANKNADHWPVTGWDVFYEGAAEHCAACNKLIESAYGDPDAEEPADEDSLHFCPDCDAPVQSPGLCPRCSAEESASLGVESEFDDDTEDGTEPETY